jgi:multidrug efflux pump
LFLVYAAVIGVMAVLYVRLPTAFLPEEDQGILFAQVQAPPGATSVRTDAIIDQARSYFMNDEKDSVESVFSVSGFGFAGHGQNAGLLFVKLKDWSLRPAASQRVQAVAGRAMRRFAGIKDAIVFAFAPPAVMELGNANGFDIELQDRAGLGHDKLIAARNQLLGMAGKSPLLMAVRPNGMEDAPQYQIHIDREKASALGLSMSDINQTLSAAWGSSYINDFIDRGRVKRVYVQGDAPSRMMPDDLNKWYVRNTTGSMVPFSAFASAEWGTGPQKLERYNGVPSVEVLGQPAIGRSTGDAMTEIEALSAKLPAGIGFEWTGLSYEERLSGSQAPALYAISLIVVFLCLAALYESWSIPAAVMMVVPLGVVGAVTATWMRGLSNDVYFQVGLLTTIGLSAKNAILIVEFAKDFFDRGASLMDAAAQAARQRLRPILMTSLAFILGVLPLAISSGAGSGSQNAIGTGVIGGMLTATFLAIFLVPLFFVVILRLFRVKPGKPGQEQPVAQSNDLVMNEKS